MQVRLLLAVIFAATCLGDAAQGVVQYRATRVPTRLYGINDVGQGTGGGTSGALLWDRVAGVQNLGTLGGNWAQGEDINNLGQVVGTSEIDESHTEHGFFWDAQNGMLDVGTLGGRRSSALAINEAGQVVGWAETLDGGHHAFVWDLRNGIRDLGTFGGTGSEAHGLNDAGQIVGVFQTLAGQQCVFRWNPEDGMEDLGTWSAATDTLDINNHAQAAGAVFGGTWESSAAMWDTDGTLRALGNLRHEKAIAAAINDAGQIVGTEWSTHDTQDNAFLWQDGELWDLTSLVIGESPSRFAVSGATDINERGQIAAYMARTYADPWMLVTGQFILTPIPEPSSAAMLAGAVLIAVAAVAARRRRE